MVGMMWWMIMAGCLAVLFVPDIYAANVTTFLAITDRGNVFEIAPPDEIPTTDIVSTPYIEFQRVGGLVVSGGIISEAAQYNTVSSGNTYIISNWGEGKTYGIPNWAPLEGEMRLYPKPHMYLRESVEVSAGVFWPDGIDDIIIQSGGIGYQFFGNGTDKQHVEFKGAGRAVIELDDTNIHYAINLVCVDCHHTARATIGNIQSPINGTSTTITSSQSCVVNSVTHAGCGVLYGTTSSRYWPYTVPVISHNPYPNHNNAILHVIQYDTVKCPTATHDNTSMERLDDQYFQLESQGCIMDNFQYRWHDGNILLDDSVPLRPGFSTYDGAANTVIVVNLSGGSIKLQTHAVPTSHQRDNAFEKDFTIHPGGYISPVDGNSVIILHDAFAHLKHYTTSDLGDKTKMSDMPTLVQPYPQLTKNTTATIVAHARQPGASGTGGLLGADCTPGFKYCFTIFDGRGLPVISSAAGKVYDSRNGIVINDASNIDNLAGKFATTRNAVRDTIYYDSTKLNLIQAYGVIPITGSIKVEELYLIVSRFDCKAFVDDSTKPHNWSPGPTQQSHWMRLTYLEGEYGSGTASTVVNHTVSKTIIDNSIINVPVLPWFGKICMKLHGESEFRQYVMDNFFVQGADASFGGIRHVKTFPGVDGLPRPNRANMEILNTEVVLLGEGTKVLDMDLKISGSVTLDGVVKGGGGTYTGGRDGSCDWHRISITMPPRQTLLPIDVEYRVDVTIMIPALSGTFERIGGLSAVGTAPLQAAQTPITVGADCRHLSYAEWDFPLEFRTIPIRHAGGEPITINVVSHITFLNGNKPAEYAGHRVTETMHVETMIDRLSVRVN